MTPLPFWVVVAGAVAETFGVGAAEEVAFGVDTTMEEAAAGVSGTTGAGVATEASTPGHFAGSHPLPPSYETAAHYVVPPRCRTVRMSASPPPYSH